MITFFLFFFFRPFPLFVPQETTNEFEESVSMKVLQML